MMRISFGGVPACEALPLSPTPSVPTQLTVGSVGASAGSASELPPGCEQ